MNYILSFYQLISKYRIEIPIIQRDYAQGRDNAKSADIRKSIISRFVKAVQDKDSEPLFLDFVYGRIEGNTFIPFYGQQRLTTLFLFHKYIFEQCQSKSTCVHKDHCICKDIIKGFSYATRQSSREFCQLLVDKNIIPNDDTLLSKNIMNQSWFFPDWEKDPTIMGMLTMLDEIHGQLKGKKDKDEFKFKYMSERLTSGCNCPISFHFVDMGEHKLSDETYVKMNARGKNLTPFENFKASLEQYLNLKKETDLQNCFKGNYDNTKKKYTGIDGIWLDLFWEEANKDKDEKVLPDSLMMSFFNRHFMNIWRCWYKKSESEKDENHENFNDRIIKMPLYPSKDDFVSWDIYQHILDSCGVEECLTPIFNILDKLCENSKNIKSDCQAVWNSNDGKDKWDLFQGQINNNRETYPSRVAFYALMMFYQEMPQETPKVMQKTSLSQWMRIVWNIIENSTIDSPGTYSAALRLISNLSSHSHNIHAFLSVDDTGIESGHAKEQVKEEIEKAKQILHGKPRSDGKSWEDVIIEAEKTAFFKGAIRFLFQDANGFPNWDEFDKKWEKAQQYFDENGVKKDFRSNALLLRALLSRIKIGENWFGYSKEFWLTSLLNSNYQSAVHYLLTTDELVIDGACEQDWIKHKDLLKELLDCESTWHILYDWRGFSVLTRYSQRRSYAPMYKDIVVLNDIRNKLLNGDNVEISPELRVGKTTYLYGWGINFKYNDHFFLWDGTQNKKEVVYIMDDEWQQRKKHSNSLTDNVTDEDTHYCFKVESGMTSDQFINKLDELINNAFNQ